MFSYKVKNKVPMPMPRTVAWGQIVQKWWWSLPIGQRLILTNMAGYLSYDGKPLVSYEQIKCDFGVAYFCYNKFA